MSPPDSTHALPSYKDGNRFFMARSAIRFWLRNNRLVVIVITASGRPFAAYWNAF